MKEQQRFLKNISDSVSTYKVTGTLKICYKNGRCSHRFFWESGLNLERETLNENNLHFLRSTERLKLVQCVPFEMDFENML